MTRLTALLIAAVLVLVPVPAAAGGPTSVMLAAPDYDRTASMYHSDPRYERLQRLIHSNEAPGDVGTNPHANGVLVRATWLAHDMYVWRIDRIYPDAPDGPWIGTSLHDSAKPMSDEKIVWHKITDRLGLLQLLAQLRLLERSGQTTMPAPTPTPEEPAVPTTQAEAETKGALTGWRWSLVGLVVGVLLTAVGFRVVRRRADASPRWELIG